MTKLFAASVSALCESTSVSRFLRESARFAEYWVTTAAAVSKRATRPMPRFFGSRKPRRRATISTQAIRLPRSTSEVSAVGPLASRYRTTSSSSERGRVFSEKLMGESTWLK
jgi:hypothetical protein